MWRVNIQHRESPRRSIVSRDSQTTFRVRAGSKKRASFYSRAVSPLAVWWKARNVCTHCVFLFVLYAQIHTFTPWIWRKTSHFLTTYRLVHFDLGTRLVSIICDHCFFSVSQTSIVIIIRVWHLAKNKIGKWTCFLLLVKKRNEWECNDTTRTAFFFL